MRKFFLVTALLLTGAAHAQITEAPRQRLISVSGEAEVKTVPDEVVLTLGLVTSDADLAKARNLNNERVKGVLAVAANLKIAPKDVATDFLTIDPRYGNGGSFTVRRKVVVTIRNVAKWDEALTRMVQNNRANSVQSIDFRTTKLRALRDQARALAMKAAREKAVALTGAVGANIGRVMTINEGYSGDSPYSYWNEWGYGSRGGYAQNMTQNVSINAGGAAAPSSTLSPGQISITARVNTTFEIE
jgi:uncharacterized protein YggE